MIMGNHQTIYFDKTNFFLILNQLIENGCITYFTYENIPVRESLEIASDIPPIKIINKICSVEETCMGIQLNIKDDGYIVLDTNICVAESVSKDLIAGYRVRMDCSFDQKPDEHYVTFSFGDFKIHISKVSEEKFSAVLDSLSELKRENAEESFDEFLDFDACNSSMDRSFWESIDNMLED